MPNYAEMTTADLIALLFREEDHATLAHIQELIKRGPEAAAPLRDILQNEEYWYEGKDGGYWIVIHAFHILSAMHDEASLPILLEMVPHAYFSNHDDSVAQLPAALAEFGPSAIPALEQFILAYRTAYHDNPDYSQCRWVVAAALTRIGLAHKEARAQVTEFICNLFADPQEDDSVFLSFAAGHPIALHKARGLEAIKAAYDRKQISTEINGSFKDFRRMAETSHPNLFDELQGKWQDFYAPAEIRQRQKERAEHVEPPLYWEPKKPAAINAAPKIEPVTRTDKVGRNDPCPCGSGKKYKKCHGGE